MFVIAWWTGKGFYVLLIPLVCAIVFGILFQAAHLPERDGPWIWAAALVTAAAITWRTGDRLNAKKRRGFGSLTWRRRLTYRARHRFMSLPMESWAAVMLLTSAAILLVGLRTDG